MQLLFGLWRSFALACLFVSLSSASEAWSHLQSGDLNFYVQGDASSARAQLLQLQQFRTLFSSPGLFTHDLADAKPNGLRIVQFASASEYKSFRLNEIADAYYLGGAGRDLIVLPGFGPQQDSISAHEYSHAIFHAAGWKLPSWLNEGLAEFFSTASLYGDTWYLGNPIPWRLSTLHKQRLYPLIVLFAIGPESAIRQSRETNALFYSESWALTELLATSPRYSSHLADFISALNRGVSASQAFSSVYGETVDAVESDLRDWLRGAHSEMLAVPAIRASSPAISTTPLAPIESDSVIADLLLAQGRWDRAQAAYEDLARRDPENADYLGALGTIALQKGNRIAAASYWKRALDGGISDPDLCMRYALLADEENLEKTEIRRALRRVIELQPNSDDARYRLAVLESNEGNFAEAAAQLHEIRSVPENRAFHYWSTLAYAEEEIGNRSESLAAAQKAGQCARTPEERGTANQLAYTAKTDFAVQFVREADGTTHLVSTRVPHGTTDWNPFVQPDDHLVQIDGQLSTVQCSGGQLTGFIVSTVQGPVSLLVPDPKRVLMRNSPPEFSCGPQQAMPVHVEYAANQPDRSRGGLLRGMTFR